MYTKNRVDKLVEVHSFNGILYRVKYEQMTVYGANGEIPQTILSERYKAWKVHIV
jgi:hypothetical protein